MRKEIVKKRLQLHILIENINTTLRDCSTEESFKLTELKKYYIKEYQFLCNLLKAL